MGNPHEESSSPTRKSPLSEAKQAMEHSTSGAESRPGTSSSQTQSPMSYRVQKRDILYRAINEFQLSGPKLNSYADLLSLLGFDLSPHISNGETWYLCRGKTTKDRPCRRMVPEVYLRTSIGGLLKAAEKPELGGDDLIEELAETLSFAICSEHNQQIHKVVRAIECRPLIEAWREKRPIKAASVRQKPSFASLAKDWRAKPAAEGSPVMLPLSADSEADVGSEPKAKLAPKVKAELEVKSDSEVESQAAVKQKRVPESGPESRLDAEDDPATTYGVAEKLKLERQYQEYLRAASKQSRRESSSSSNGSSVEMSTEKRWTMLRTSAQ